ncbi:MAG: ferrous iron transporter B, partial [Bacilli bacterium]|nr:ferrous iron transporter B [Bacilli bacterium]
SRWFGIPFFVLILFLIFHFSFSTNFLFLQGLLPSTPSFASTPFEGLIWTEAGLNSPGEMLKMAVEGLFNLLSEGVASLFGSEDWWAKGLLIDGVIAGVGSVLSFIPQVLLVYLFFSLLEDSGYMARVCFLLDRIMRKFGLSGRALIPLIMGFGCSVPAMMNTRTLNNEKEKTMTLRVIPFFPCSAKLPILTGLAGALASRALLPYPDLLTVAMYLLCLFAAMLALILMSRTTMRGETPPFLMELPPYHRPQAQALFLHLWEKMKHFLVKAFTIILASTILVWFLMHFSFAWEYLPEERIDESILSSIGQFLLPVFTPLGFGIQTSNIAIDGVVFNFGWAFIVVTLTGLIAKENVIGVLSVVASCVLTFARSKGVDLGDEPLEALLQATGVGAPALFSFIAFNLLTIPCVSAVATARSELTRKGFLGTLVFWIVFSFCFSAGIYVMLTWWWTVFPILGVLILVVILLYVLPKPKKGATA